MLVNWKRDYNGDSDLMRWQRDTSQFVYHTGSNIPLTGEENIRCVLSHLCPY